jgi:hypothetical protein
MNKTIETRPISTLPENFSDEGRVSALPLLQTDQDPTHALDNKAMGMFGF